MKKQTCEVLTELIHSMPPYFNSVYVYQIIILCMARKIMCLLCYANSPVLCLIPNTLEVVLVLGYKTLCPFVSVSIRQNKAGTNDAQ